MALQTEEGRAPWRSTRTMQTTHTRALQAGPHLQQVGGESHLSARDVTAVALDNPPEREVPVRRQRGAVELAAEVNGGLPVPHVQPAVEVGAAGDVVDWDRRVPDPGPDTLLLCFVAGDV